LLSSLVVGVILLIPQATSWAHSSLTASISPLSADRALRSENSWTRGFIDYWGLRHRLIDGFPRIVMLFGLMVGAIAAVQRKIDRGAFVAALSAGVLTAAAIAASVHGEPRYLVPAFPWFWLGAAAGIAYMTRFWTRSVGIAVLVLSLILIIPASWRSSEEKHRWNIINDSTLKSAAMTIDAASVDYECTVVTSHRPMVLWYSRCWTMDYDRDTVINAHPLLPDGDRFLVVIEEGGRRQATGPLLEEYVEEAGELFATFGNPGDGRDYIRIYRTSAEG
jgi:hypothetical protein